MSASLIGITADFFRANIPSAALLMAGGPAGLAWAYACLAFAGWLKRAKSLRTGYTRKVFHFLIFTSVVAIHSAWGTPAVCLFGGMATMVIIYAILRGDGHPLYEAMAREKDAPHRTHFIVAPYFATLIGGLASNILFGRAAVVGYLVAGLGDAIGEPVGTRFGRHTYAVPSLRGAPSTRSWEGSAAVFLASWLALAVALRISPALHSHPFAPLTLMALAAVSAVVEAVSPHGWDNATMQIVPTFLTTLAFC